ncbi:MAG TPA: hypothetical protein VGG68_13630 [Caulobacteraceae bacterium]|jgi:hypothetical protein
MIKICAAVLVLAAGTAAFSSAQAAGGCGWGLHRGPYGGCRANGSNALVTPPPHAVVVAPARPVVVAPAAGAVVVAPAAGVVYAPAGRACPYGYHLGPQGHHCWPN